MVTVTQITTMAIQTIIMIILITITAQVVTIMEEIMTIVVVDGEETDIFVLISRIFNVK